MNEELKFYKRSDVVNFMGLTADATEYIRMKGFTSAEDSTNVETDETKYVDEKNKRKRTTGYATEKSYEADRIVGNKIHDLLAEVQELEKTDVNVPIVTVDFNKEGTTANTYKARRRLYSVIPDSAGGDENKYTISGTLGANGEIEEGEATSSDNWKTCTFTAKSTTSVSEPTVQSTSTKTASASK